MLGEVQSWKIMVMVGLDVNNNKHNDNNSLAIGLINTVTGFGNNTI